jgi:hypothetical protein
MHTPKHTTLATLLALALALSGLFALPPLVIQYARFRV